MTPDQIPAEIVEKARRVLMVHGPSQGAEPHPIETDHPETAGWVEGWREAWTAVPDILAAVLPEVQALALQEARNEVSAMERAFVTSEWGTVVRKLHVMELLADLAAAQSETSQEPDRVSAAPWEIRTNPDGSLDEVIATGARVHLEEMNHGQWWLGIDVGNRTLHVNFGVVNPRAKTYAHAEDAS